MHIPGRCWWEREDDQAHMVLPVGAHTKDAEALGYSSPPFDDMLVNLPSVMLSLLPSSCTGPYLSQPFARPQPDAVSCLVVGTESGRVLILNAAGTAIVKNIWVGITPAMIAVQVRTCIISIRLKHSRDVAAWNLHCCPRACMCFECVSCEESPFGRR